MFIVSYSCFYWCANVFAFGAYCKFDINTIHLSLRVLSSHKVLNQTQIMQWKLCQHGVNKNAIIMMYHFISG